MTNPNPPTHWALAAAVTEEFLNHLAAEAIGPGLPPNELRQEFNIPMLGPVDLTVRLQIVSVRFTMRAEDEGKLRATIGARGEVEFNGDMAMPPLPGAAIVNGEVLVDPIVEFKPSGRFRAVLDLKNSQLIGMGFEGFEGVDTDADMAAQMGNMLFAAVGGELFEALAAGMDTTGLELEPSEGQYLSELGVAFGSAEFAIEDGLMTVGLPALPGVEGRAEPTPVFGHRLGVAIAAGALTSLVNQLASPQLGLLRFEIDLFF